MNIITWTILYIELLFAPLALFSRIRPLLWLSMFIIQLGFAFLLNFPDLTAAMVLFHIFTFDPAWIKPKKATGKEILYYDGHCGLCHRVIRFLLAEDQAGIFKFSPLQSMTFEKALSKEERNKLPDSIVLLTGNGQTLTCSSAVIYLLNHLGGMWRIMGLILWLVPKFIRDFGYNFIGSIRYKLFKQPDDVCPLIPEQLRSRFYKK